MLIVTQLGKLVTCFEEAFSIWSHNLKSGGLVGFCHNMNKLYLHFYKIYGKQTWQNAYFREKVLYLNDQVVTDLF